MVLVDTRTFGQKLSLNSEVEVTCPADYQELVVAAILSSRAEVSRVVQPWLALPKNQTACIHLEQEYLSEGIEVKRCPNYVVRHQSGYLCSQHQARLFRRPKVETPRVEYLDFIMQDILATIQRELKTAMRQEIQCDAKGQSVLTIDVQPIY